MCLSFCSAYQNMKVSGCDGKPLCFQFADIHPEFLGCLNGKQTDEDVLLVARCLKRRERLLLNFPETRLYFTLRF